MDVPITIGGLIAAVGILAGVALILMGMLTTFAAGMASAPDQGLGSKGCLLSLAGIVVLAVSIWRLF